MFISSNLRFITYNTQVPDCPTENTKLSSINQLDLIIKNDRPYMFSVFDSSWIELSWGSSTGRGHCIVFLGKDTGLSRVEMCTDELLGQPHTIPGRGKEGGACDGLAPHPEGILILLVARCY